MSKRFCTMPNIPFLRDWFEGKFGDLCEAHDMVYTTMLLKQEKDESDFEFAKGVAMRGHVWLAILALIAFQLPWVGGHVR